MKTYYCVTSTVYDDGRMTAAITSEIEAAIKPEDHCTSTSRRDIYTDWFVTYEDAEAFVKETREA
ncbi:hypothetical protein [Ruminococcus sp.]|uniref:hypothetical protein n=1 Tax=Ruminococcus sp. TaxID=41978 RepID=UPI0025F1C0C8|nr:hypothetical protein [Ruminococcus sp.]MBQ8966758.1 hypothetical protein [Ruminococcus sp.]